ncbi:ornithine cyclodeaminase family protein [Colwellia sp. 6_MG-2023]|uniref:ornithine cyclodeaminase family protein n=1 Tax=Colwellia sp. 6_MG-2023 TaxID=3062676 RepID=UPI0026E2773D|nr:ornithine cyclodeaminase family protein [Colwellia sp. 6_MG-2023]MDO6489241.1 ornithine cyclodeaminase family protein [Colwellia sp. 6_MG-2023]
MSKDSYDNIRIIDELGVSNILTIERAANAVENVFANMYTGSARNFPTIREQLLYADAIYGFKSGFYQGPNGGPILGLKSGGYWPNNQQNQLANHQSTVILFNPDSGQLQALVAGNYLTALRTAAASAVSIKYLAREDVKTLSIIGAGGQAEHQLRAACKQRSFNRLLIANRNQEKAIQLGNKLSDLNLDIEIVNFQTACEQADVLITICSSWEAIVQHQWIQPGTHIACMGTDTKGKQEVDINTLIHAQIFCDELEQAISIGECQHAFASNKLKRDEINSLGAVIVGEHPGRLDQNSITLFDSTGVSLQDLACAQLVLDLKSELTI